MKKFLFFALLSCAALAGKAQTSYSLYIDGFPYNYTAAFSGKIAITFTDQYGEFKLTQTNTVDASVYTGYRIVVSEASSCQFKLTYGGADHYPAVSVGENTGTFTSNLTAFELQGKSAGSYVTVEEAYLIKADGTEEEMVYGGDAWGCKYDVYEPAVITYTGQYGGNYINDPETNEPFTYTYGSGKKHTFTVTLAEALPQNLLVELDENGEGYAWINLMAGESEYTFVIDDAACTKYDKTTGEVTGHGDEVSYLYIKCDEDADSGVYPFTVNFKSIVDVVSDADAEDESGNDENVEQGEGNGSDEEVGEGSGEEGNDENVDEENNGDDENVDQNTGGDNTDEEVSGEGSGNGSDEDVSGEGNTSGEDGNTSGEDGSEGDSTGIDSVPAASGESVYYNLAGQRVDGSTGGLLVKDGKKVLVK
ncbi:MAG: hypothetical protein LUC26_00300 [Prevotella sp.]|nr:hypothetical protein [Prevotella sp.]